MKEAEEIKLPKLPEPAAFRDWKVTVMEVVSTASGRPDPAFQWINEVDRSGVSVRGLADSGEFPTLDQKLASAILVVISINGSLSREIRNLRQRYQQGYTPERVKGRQMFNMIIDHYAVSETEGHMLDLRGLLAVTVVNDDLEYFVQEWGNTRDRMKNAPEDAYLHDRFEKQVEYPPC